MKKLFPFYCVVLVCVCSVPFLLSKTALQVNQNTPVSTGMTVVIDPGHGLPDGGAISCTGARESDINLEISRRLNDLFHLFGIKTVMTRSGVDSIYTEGDSIAHKKISDTKNRVKMINSADNALLLSIHQNHFYDSQYSGAQVFYTDCEESRKLANMLQSNLVAYLNPTSNRKAKESSGVYLMKHIKCTGVLIECGFLSNFREEDLLRSEGYQKQICAVIATSCLSYMNQHNIS